MTDTNELYVGREVWVKVLYCEDTRKGGPEERWRQCWVTRCAEGERTVTVRWYENPYTEQRQTFLRADVKTMCLGNPLFSC